MCCWDKKTSSVVSELHGVCLEVQEDEGGLGKNRGIHLEARSSTSLVYENSVK